MRGYPLENRSYQSDDIDYKFTGKQRDAETDYDYFGARYYDARIGRWGGVELVNEKIFNYSPYSYAMLNPISNIDIGGFYPRIHQEGNTVYVQTTYFYVTDKYDKEKGLNQLQVDNLQKMIKNMNQWSGFFQTADGKTLYLQVDVTMRDYNELRTNFDYPGMITNINKAFIDGGYSLISNIDAITIETKNQGISHQVDGDVLSVTRKMDPYETTGAHEFGHLLGLENEASTNRTTPTIMQPVDIIREEGKADRIIRNNPDLNDRLKAYNILKNNKRL